jgi:hypothetical protein
MRLRLFLFLSLLGGALQAADFKGDVLPLMRQHCYKCHGNGKTKGDLSLEVEDIGSHIGAKGPIRPGDGESKIIQLITEKVGDRMPAKGPPLSEEEIAIITEWVKEGAGLGKGVPFAVKNQKAIAVGEWTNTEGVKIAAELLGVEKEKALFRMKEKIHRVPLEKLSEESRKKVREAVEGGK